MGKGGQAEVKEQWSIERGSACCPERRIRMKGTCIVIISYIHTHNSKLEARLWFHSSSIASFFNLVSQHEAFVCVCRSKGQY